MDFRVGPRINTHIMNCNGSRFYLLPTDMLINCVIRFKDNLELMSIFLLAKSLKIIQAYRKIIIMCTYIYIFVRMSCNLNYTY